MSLSLKTDGLHSNGCNFSPSPHKGFWCRPILFQVDHWSTSQFSFPLLTALACCHLQCNKTRQTCRRENILQPKGGKGGFPAVPEQDIGPVVNDSLSRSSEKPFKVNSRMLKTIHFCLTPFSFNSCRSSTCHTVHICGSFQSYFYVMAVTAELCPSANIFLLKQHNLNNLFNFKVYPCVSWGFRQLCTFCTSEKTCQNDKTPPVSI